MGGWVSLVLGNLAQRAYSPQGGGGVWVGGWVGGWVGRQLGRGWVGLDSSKLIITDKKIRWQPLQST